MTAAETAFLTAKTMIENEIMRLQELSDDHFNTNPEAINWTDVAELNRILDALKKIA
jgi:hypothetical protein